MSDFKATDYWEERLNKHYDYQGVGDIGFSRNYNHWLYEVRRRVFRRAVASIELDVSKISVLDVGSGTGVYVSEWIRCGARDVTGVDIAASAISRLRAAFPSSRFIGSDISDPSVITTLGKTYGAISAFDVLFHIIDDQKFDTALKNISSLLEPRGWFFYSDNLVSSEHRLTHYVSRPESTILDSLRRNGFELVSRRPMFMLMNDPVRTRSRALRRWHSIVARLAGRGNFTGSILGATLFPIEIGATRFARSGVSTEVLVCRRSG